MKEIRQELAEFVKEREWEQFHSPKNLAMALSVEASELLEIFQWKTEEESKKLSPEEIEHLKEEIADVFLYLINLASKYEIDIIEASHAKMVQNRKKYPADLARGKSDKYDAYKRNIDN